ncbi:MAG TPA: nuclear transport factor 2 family protein [Solirubrobacterales bacterium]
MDIVRRQYQAMNESLTFLSVHAHPEVEWMAAREDPDAATHRGPEAIQAYFESWGGMIRGIAAERLEVIENGDIVFVWIRITGRGVESDAPVAMEQAQVWKFRDGKIERVEEYFDRTEGRRAAGVEPG